MEPMAHLGVGIGWRPEIAEAVEGLPGLDWVEVVAENICPGHLPESLRRLLDRGVRVVPHGVSLGLGGADRPDPAKLAALGERAVALGAPLVTEHIAFVRTPALGEAPALEAGHLLPVPRTRDALDVLCENVRIAQDALPVPLALENIAALLTWPGEELTEGQFLTELVERTGVRLLIDVANLHTNRVNRGEDPAAVLDGIPLEALAYVHVAGGVERDGVWHDTHAHPVPRVVLDVLAELRARVDPPGVLLERDDDFPAEAELAGELAAIRGVLLGGPAGQIPYPPFHRSPGSARTRASNAGGAGVGSARTRSSNAGGAGVGSARTRSSNADGAGTGSVTAGDEWEKVRTRVGVGQAALLSALVAGTPVPEGFDGQRVRVQARALAAKRAGVVARLAPELPGILGGEEPFREAFLGYARNRPMASGYRRDALDFAEHLLIRDLPADPAARRRLTLWWQDRAGVRPPRRVVRWARALTGRAA
ncbi:multinuclear nonheme iron-dependent oxidase [Streptomyces sp. NPDC054956]